ncbi:MAG TPA: DUF531 family protein, partial [Candidatus Thermoplasmatota archaeon]|nr:DUF531 family protein [Candidatus Thermoplasmatota archaeon]
MPQRPEAHPPSHARALVQEAKQGGRPIAALLAEAAAVADPSFAAEALFALSQDPRLAPAQAAAVLDDVARLLESVPRGWRKAEAIGTVARKAGAWRDGERESGPARLRFLGELLRIVLAMPDGQALAQAVEALAPCLPAQHQPALLARALANRGFEAEGAKAVLRTAVAAGSVAPTVEALQACPDDALRARLLGALHHQLGRTEPAHAAAVLQHALASAAKVADPAARLEVLRQLIASSETVAALHQIVASPGPDPNVQARVLSAAGGRADKLGDAAQAHAWLTAGLAAAAGIEDPKARAAALANLNAGLERLAGQPPSKPAHPSPPPETVRSTSPAPGPPTPPPTREPDPAIEVASPSLQAAQAEAGTAPRRHVLALYDTYEGGLKEVHLRAIARAAPLCAAFGLDLALMGFPADNVRALAGQAAAETNIGDGGRHLEELVASGRVRLVSCTTREPPQDWSAVGLPVAATSEPDATKLMDFPQLPAAARAAGFDRVCLLMGLGKRGLPPSLLKAVRHHLELTGRRVSLETATAMGVLAERLRQLPPA